MTTEPSCFFYLKKKWKKQLHNKLTITKFTKIMDNSYCDSSINRRKGTLNKHQHTHFS